MAIINKGTAFSNGEQLSASKLNDLLDGATFGTDSVDNASTLLNETGAITVRDSGITAAKLATNAVTTAKILNANVTKAKIENVADYKVLGNVSGAAAAPAEVAILDEDDMVSNSDTALATQQSIKTYVDATAGGFTPSTYAGGESVTLPNGLIMKFGSQSVPGDSTATVSFATSFPGGIVQVQLTIKTAISLSSDAGVTATSQTVSGFTIQNGASFTETISWMAIGY
jgi:uncharacterized protein (AIM24 family)